MEDRPTRWSADEPALRPPGSEEADVLAGVDALDEGAEPSPLPWRKTRAAKALLAAVLAFVVVLASLAGLLWLRVNKALDDINRHDWNSHSSTRPAAPTAMGPQQPMTVLLLGADKRGADRGRSDSMMLAYLPANRQHIYLISIPRDSYVAIPGHGKQKINAAYSLGDVPLARETVEKLLDVQVQHAALINFENFIRLTDVLGGVTVNNPEASTMLGKYTFPAGEITLKGDAALYFVQQRHELSQGDLSRAQRQRAMIQGIFKKALSLGVLGNPATFSALLDRTKGLVEVDNELTSETIRNTGFSLANVRGDDVRGIQIPLSGFDTLPGVGAVDIVDRQRLTELSIALQTDTMDAYYDKHKDDPLVGPASNAQKTSPTKATTKPTRKRNG